jgi:hypothetical protein
VTIFKKDLYLNIESVAQQTVGKTKTKTSFPLTAGMDFFQAQLIQQKQQMAR